MCSGHEQEQTIGKLSWQNKCYDKPAKWLIVSLLDGLKCIKFVIELLYGTLDAPFDPFRSSLSMRQMCWSERVNMLKFRGLLKQNGKGKTECNRHPLRDSVPLSDYSNIDKIFIIIFGVLCVYVCGCSCSTIFILLFEAS